MSEELQKQAQQYYEIRSQYVDVTQQLKELNERMIQRIEEAQQEVEQCRELLNKLEKEQVWERPLVADSMSEEEVQEIQHGIHPVGKQYLTKPPYHSVGKLFFFYPGRKEMDIATAFYIGNSKIMTAAHAFDDEKIDDGIFVPAMINEYDIYGYNFGYYPVNGSPHVHSEYKTKELKPKYDICTFEVGTGKMMLNKMARGILKPNWFLSITETKLFRDLFMKIFTDIKIDDIGLSPIRCIPVSYPPQNDTTWIAIGYGIKEDGGEANDGSDGGKMSQAKGKIVTGQEALRIGGESLAGKNTLVMNIALRKGMSGGPWILESSMAKGAIATGCQTGANSPDSDHPWSFSPRFSIDFLTDIHALPHNNIDALL